MCFSSISTVSGYGTGDSSCGGGKLGRSSCASASELNAFAAVAQFIQSSQGQQVSRLSALGSCISVVWEGQSIRHLEMFLNIIKKKKEIMKKCQPIHVHCFLKLQQMLQNFQPPEKPQSPAVDNNRSHLHLQAQAMTASSTLTDQHMHHAPQPVEKKSHLSQGEIKKISVVFSSYIYIKH